jgi:putative heme iron utilization protein
MSNKEPVDPKEQIKHLMCLPKAFLGSSASRDGDIFPAVSLVIPALNGIGRPILLLSDLSDHVRNLRGDPRASLLFDGTSGMAEPLTGPRVTVLGKVSVTEDLGDRMAYLAQHPSAALYADFRDFHFYLFVPQEALLVAGFGRIHRFDAADLA